MLVALENIRSLYNVGAIFRTCSFFGVKKVFLVGYSGKRPLPDGSWELNEKIEKTSLGTIKDLEIVLVKNSEELVKLVKKNRLKLVAVEIGKKSIKLEAFKPTKKDVLVFGNEVNGVSKAVLEASDEIVEIPRLGNKTSLNVATTAGIVIHEAR